MEYVINQKVYITVGRHRGVVENVVQDMFENSPLYLVRTKGGKVIPVREEAMEEYKVSQRQKR